MQAIGPADGASLFVEDRQDLSVEIVNGRGGPTADHSRTRGVACQAGGHLRFAAGLGPEDLEAWVGEARPPALRHSTVAQDRARADPWLSTELATETLGWAVDASQKLQKSATVQARWVEFEQRVHVARPGERVFRDVRRCRRLRLRVALSRRGREADAVGEAVLRQESAEESRKRLESLAEEVAARAEARLGAETPTPGERRIVFAAGVGGVLFHEIVGHALEADTVAGGASWLAGSATEAFRGSPQLTVVDDPRRGRAAWRLDDEGTEARPVPLLREGQVGGRLHDRASALRSGSRPTGHGRRASFRDPVRPRMGCTFLAAGSCDPAEVLRGVEDGIYVRRMEAASTDTRTGRAEFRVTDADRILHGRLAAPLTPHVMILNAVAALSSVDRVANDLLFDSCIGSCLSHGQPLSVTVGAPTFRIGLTRIVS